MRAGVFEMKSPKAAGVFGREGSLLALVMATLAFTVSFAVWGMLAPMANTFQSTLRLTQQQTWMLVAVPVLLGSIGRLPMGMLADRIGGRLAFGGLLIFISLPAFLLSVTHSYGGLLVAGLLLGIAGTSFSVGVAFTSKWFEQKQQGLVLGIYGAGNIGQSLALFGIPPLAGLCGWQSTYRLFGAAALVCGIMFLLIARNSPVAAEVKPLSAMVRVLIERPLCWLLSLFYFVTFGGFVALGLGLPKLLQDIFHLTRADAGLRVAGYVVAATVMRPVGGWLSDRVGGARLLAMAFLGAGVLALGMISDHIVLFTIGALGVAACIGMGNGGVFKLVPQYFAEDTGAVTGLVGAIGGLGGFFPPLVLGLIKTSTGSYSLGFVFLSAFCILCLVLDRAILLRGSAGLPDLRSRRLGVPPEQFSNGLPGIDRRRSL